MAGHQLGDQLLFGKVEDLAGGIVNVGRRRRWFDPTMGPAQDAEFAQPVDIPADGLGRDFEPVRQFLHRRKTGFLDQVRDFGLTF